MNLQFHLRARPRGRLRAGLAYAPLAFGLPTAASDGTYSKHIAALTHALRKSVIEKQEP